jgi:hypothetical protein
MEETKNLAELHKEISQELLEPIHMLEILSDMTTSSKESALLDILTKNITSAFSKVSNCRRMIYICD